jgi:hypothetical protein
MTIDEQRLGRRLEQSAGRLTTAWLHTMKLPRQIRRQRSRIISAVADPVVAAGAVAVAIGVALSASDWQPSGRRPPRTPMLSYTITVNGQAQVSGPDSELPSYAVSPGEDLPIIVDATVPEGVTVTSLWLGITNGILTPDRDGPHNMTPVLVACTDSTLGPGVHRFSFSWAVPAELRPGARRQLSVQWAWRTQSSGMSQRFIAELEVQASLNT